MAHTPSGSTTRRARSPLLRRCPATLVFFYNYANNFIGHVGIYAGNGMMWHAPRTGRVVSLERVYTDKVYYARVLNQ